MTALLEEAFTDDVPPLERFDRFVHGYGGTPRRGRSRRMVWGPGAGFSARARMCQAASAYTKRSG
jgi:hypothetical protein